MDKTNITVYIPDIYVYYNVDKIKKKNKKKEFPTIKFVSNLKDIIGLHFLSVGLQNSYFWDFGTL